MSDRVGLSVRPLRRVCPGVWRSRDERWTFKRHESDPTPKRWFVYEADDEYPCNEGSGITTLLEAADWAEAEQRRDEAQAREAQAPLPASVSATPEGSQGSTGSGA